MTGGPVGSAWQQQGKGRRHLHQRAVRTVLLACLAVGRDAVRHRTERLPAARMHPVSVGGRASNLLPRSSKLEHACMPVW